MRASRVRKRILDEHDRLRGLLDQTDRQALRVSQGAGEGVGTLRVLGIRLLTQFSEHLALEDRVLAPALRRAGPAGRARAEMLDADHREQRMLLDYLLGGVRDASRPAVVLASEWHGFVELVLEDMAQEERVILEKSLLTGVAPAKSPSRGALKSRDLGR